MQEKVFENVVCKMVLIEVRRQAAYCQLAIF